MVAGEKRLPLNVQLSGESGVLARWSAVRTEGAKSETSPLGAEFKVFGGRTASLSMSEGGGRSKPARASGPLRRRALPMPVPSRSNWTGSLV